MRILSLITAFAGTVAVFLPFPASAASFDCANARTWEEVAICGDHELNGLDITLGRLYSALRSKAKNKDRQSEKALVSSQRAWLTRRRAECGDPETYGVPDDIEAATSCLKDMYRRRIMELNPPTIVGSDGTAPTGKRGQFLQVLMSDDDRICGKIFGILDSMLPKIPFGARPDQDPIFIRWTEARNIKDKKYFADEEYSYAEFDINNDGSLDFVMRHSFQNSKYVPSYAYFISVYDMARKDEMLSGRLPFIAAENSLARWRFSFDYSKDENYIPVTDRTGPYPAKKLGAKGADKRFNESGPIIPFTVDGVTYILFYISNIELFRPRDREYVLWGGVLRLNPDASAEDICYFEPL